MFGHRAGKVEKKLDLVIDYLKSAKNQIDTRIRVGHTLNEGEMNTIITGLDESIKELKKIKEVSGQIHDIVNANL